MPVIAAAGVESEHAESHRQRAAIDRLSVPFLMVVAALGTVLARVHPTGAVVSDVVVALGLGALVVLASSRANAWACVIAAAVATAASSGVLQAVAAVALLIAAVDAFVIDL